MKKNISFGIGAVSVIFAAILWSLDGTLVRPQFYSVSPLLVVFLEHFLGAIALSPFLFLGYKKLKNIKRKDVLALFWVCLFGGFIGTLAITEAFFAGFRGETTISTIIILQKLQPVFALFLAGIILKEKLDRNFYFWAILSIVSAYFIAFGNLGDEIFNVNFLSIPAFYAFIAAFAFGSSTVFGKNLVDDLGFKLTAFLRFGLTSLIAFVGFLTFGSFGDFENLTPIHYQLLILIVFTSGAGALFLYYFGLKKISASAATIFELAWPLSAIFFDYYFNGNFLTPIQIIFSLVLLLSFFMIVTKRKIF